MEYGILVSLGKGEKHGGLSLEVLLAADDDADKDPTENAAAIDQVSAIVSNSILLHNSIAYDRSSSAM